METGAFFVAVICFFLSLKEDKCKNLSIIRIVSVFLFVVCCGFSFKKLFFPFYRVGAGIGDYVLFLVCLLFLAFSYCSHGRLGSIFPADGNKTNITALSLYLISFGLPLCSVFLTVSVVRSAPYLDACLLACCIFLAANEELFFRQYLDRQLLSSYGIANKAIRYLVIAALFAVGHLAGSQIMTFHLLLKLVLFSLFASYTKDSLGSVVWPILLHAVMNYATYFSIIYDH
jgi:CAAX amino terminal protease family.